MCLENLSEMFQMQNASFYVLLLSSMFAFRPPLLVEDIKGWIAELCTKVQLHSTAIVCTVLGYSAIYCFTVLCTTL